ncbi:MAG: DsbC family protein, partial [Gammaproteobacteria bacterium]|nr:DsbC family protein [Gammaproteobacteria bacterium]
GKPPVTLMKSILIVALSLFWFPFVTSIADDAKADIEHIESMLGKHLPDIEITSLSTSPVAGVYELVSDGQIYYVSADGAYIFDGDLIDMEKRLNLTTARKGNLHLELINAVDEADMLVYDTPDESDRAITVFTDVSCGYCRKLHAELDQLLDGGVRVRYLMFPRAGLGSQAHKDLESVWCAENPQDAMTVAKAGGAIDPESCANPIESHVELAQKVGLRGTPLIYLDNGQMIPGYRSAQELVQMINSSEPM